MNQFDPDNRRERQTLLAVALSLSAIVGTLSGGVSAALVSGVINGSSAFGPALTDSADMDRELSDLIQEESATIAVVERVTPAVVSVVIEQRRGDLEEGYDSDFFYDPYFEEVELTEEESNELVEIGGGTGFFVTSDGYIATNRHVVSDVNAVFTVVTSDGVELPATVVAEDPYLDLAILHVEGEGYPTVTLGDSQKIRIGQTVIAIGNTLSEFRNTVTKGVVSGIDRRVYAGDEFGEEIIDHAIQTDAAINPGNSGGPLINLLGEVIGVNTAISYEGQSVGFAIPINDTKKAVDDVRRYGRIIRPWIGVRYVMLTPEMAEREGLLSESGAWLVAGSDETLPAVVEGGPADEAGLLEGDIILSVNGKDMTVEREFGPTIATMYPGDVVTLKVARGEEVLERVFELGEAPTDP